MLTRCVSVGTHQPPPICKQRMSLGSLFCFSTIGSEGRMLVFWLAGQAVVPTKPSQGPLLFSSASSVHLSSPPPSAHQLPCILLLLLCLHPPSSSCSFNIESPKRSCGKVATGGHGGSACWAGEAGLLLSTIISKASPEPASLLLIGSLPLGGYLSVSSQ